MKVVVFVKATKESEAGVLPDEKLLTDMGKYNEELVNAGIMLAGEGLKPSSNGVRVRFSGASRTVIDGPFLETNELVAGFWLWRVKSMEEAVEWVKRCPNPMISDSEIEIRPLYEAEDFGDAMTPELREQEASLRAQTLGLGPIRYVAGTPLRLTGLVDHYTLETRGGIPSLWCRFVPHIGTVPGQIGGMTTYGVSFNAKPNGEFDYMAAVEASAEISKHAELTEIQIPARRYAVFTHAEAVDSIPAAFDAIYGKWIPECGLKIAKAPCFERYTEEFNPQTGRGGIEFWIPLEN